MSARFCSTLFGNVGNEPRPFLVRLRTYTAFSPINFIIITRFHPSLFWIPYTEFFKKASLLLTPRIPIENIDSLSLSLSRNEWKTKGLGQTSEPLERRGDARPLSERSPLSGRPAVAPLASRVSRTKFTTRGWFDAARRYPTLRRLPPVPLVSSYRKGDLPPLSCLPRLKQ